MSNPNDILSSAIKLLAENNTRILSERDDARRSLDEAYEERELAVRRAEGKEAAAIAEMSRRLRLRYAAIARRIGSECFWPTSTWACEKVARDIESDL